MTSPTREERIRGAWGEALKAVSSRGMHRDELLEHLSREGYSIDEAQMAIWRLLDAGFLDYVGVDDVEVTERAPVDA